MAAGHRDRGITEVYGATTDLADLLSALDDTASISQDQDQLGHEAQDLSASLRAYLPKQESIESLRSTVSDVPDDLRALIQSVSDRISEIEVDMEDEAESALLIESDIRATEEIVDGYGFSNGDALLVLSDGSGGSTASSFEGHISTAAMALRSMLDGPGPGEKEPRYTRKESVTSQSESRSQLRDSVQEYLSVARPAVSNSHMFLSPSLQASCLINFLQVGERMMDRLDFEVSLTSLVEAHSPPSSPERGRPGVRRLNSESSSDPDPTTSSLGSPTPANGLRRSISRYSGGPRTVQPSRPPSYGSSSEEGEAEGPPPVDYTSATNLSISSTNSSPCPTRQRRIPMLTHTVPPPPMPGFRFPPPPKAKFTPQGQQPWTQTHSSTSPQKLRAGTDNDLFKKESPFKKAFNPLEQFKLKAHRQISGTSSSEDDTGEVQQAKSGSSGTSKKSLQFPS